MSNHPRRPPQTRKPNQETQDAHAAAADAHGRPPGLRVVDGPDGPRPLTPAEQAAAQANEARMAAAAEMRRMLENDPAELLTRLPELFGNAIAQMVAAGVQMALQQVPVKTARVCGRCLGARLAWNSRHAGLIQQIQERIMADLGTTDPNDPRLQQVDLPALLPPELRPGGGPDALPVVLDAITVIGGEEICPQHHPLMPANQRQGLLVVPGMNVHAAAAMAMAGMPGMPGIAPERRAGLWAPRGPPAKRPRGKPRPSWRGRAAGHVTPVPGSPATGPRATSSQVSRRTGMKPPSVTPRPSTAPASRPPPTSARPCGGHPI